MTRSKAMRSSKRIKLGLALFLTLNSLTYFFPIPSHAADGDLDATFGGSTSAPPGVARTSFGANHTGQVNALGIQTLGGNAGKIVAGGYDQGTGIDFALTRCTTGGILDTTFGSGGFVTTDFNASTDRIFDLAISSTDKIVAVGGANKPGAACGFNSDSFDIAVAVYNADGSLDATFNPCGSSPCGGKRTIDFFGCDDFANAVLIQPADNKIVLTGESQQFDSMTATLTSYLVLARINPDGMLDNTFGTAGSGKISFNELTSGMGTPSDIALYTSGPQAGKFIVVGRSTTNDFFVARFNSDGSLDNNPMTGFGPTHSGVVTTNFMNTDAAASVVLQPDNKIIAGGIANLGTLGTQDFAMARYNTDGTLDGGFGSSGKVTTDFSGSGVNRTDSVNFVGLNSNGKIILAGLSSGDDGSPQGVAIARYDGTNGSLDASFGTGGKVINHLGQNMGVDNFANQIGSHGGDIQSDGKILVGGSISTVTQSGVDFFVARFQNTSIDCTLTCPANITKSNDPNQCGAVTTFANPSEVGASCTGVITCSPASGSFFPVGTTTVTCSDSAVPSCSFTVTVNDTQNPTITCPSNITVAGTTCQNVTYTTPTPSDNCPGATATCTPASGTCFPVGTTTVTCTAKDASMNMSMCSFTVTVSDCTISCPANITTGTGPGATQCCAVVNYPAPTTGGACGTVTCTPASGSCFPVGTTTVTCTTTSGPSCSFTITVSDTTPPTITCPANITKPTDPNQCQAVVTYPTPVVSDNCPGVGAPTCSPASGSTFPKGTTTVTCSVKDAANNMSMCSFTVTVNDTQPPTVTCPANIFVAAAAMCPPANNATVSFTATASDNCPGVVVVCAPPSGSMFPVGTTSVTCTATDTSGNTASCSFTVSVFSACMVDETNAGNVVLFNTQSGDYRFCCNGSLLATGTGVLTIRGCIGTIDHLKGNRKVHIEFDFSANNGRGKGTAALFLDGSSNPKCKITDMSMAGNVCSCPAIAGPMPIMQK
jgi:uncharacterized delta-60 repeat protein